MPVIITDHDLLKKLREGDEPAFHELYTRHSRRVLAFAYHMTHSAIECGRQLRNQHGIMADDIAAIALAVHRGSARICNIPAPTDGLVHPKPPKPHQPV